MPSLGEDLAAIRKELDLSIEDIQKATKIPAEILLSIEDDSIFSDLKRNTTYIRSYVRSYAKVLDIDNELIVQALDEVAQGAYSGLLRDETGAGATSKFRYDSDSDENGEPESESEEGEKKDMVHDHVPAGEAARPEGREIGGGESSQGKPEPPSVGSVDWVDMGRKFKPSQKRKHIRTGLILAGIVAVAAILLFLFWNKKTASDTLTAQGPSEKEMQAATPDSLQLNLGPAAPVSEAGDTVRPKVAGEGALPDTLRMAIYAAYGKLEPVRVFSDVLGSLNPYWIEQGEAIAIEFVNTIRIRGQYNRMELLLNGHAIQDFRERFLDPESGMLEISREVFEGDPKWLQPAPDSLGIEAPPPDTVRKRPIFN